MKPIQQVPFSSPQQLFAIPTLPSLDISIPTYPLMIGVGAIGMLVCTLLRRDRFSLNRLQCIFFTLILTACGITGAKVLYVLENIQDAFSGSLAPGGVSFFGSVYLIPLAMPLIGKLFGQTPSKTNDLCAPCVAIMIAFIRIGCLMNGCCGGRVVYMGNYYFSWPTQIMESIGDFTICYLLLRAERQESKQGLLYPLFMIYYSVLRFFIEFLRYKPDAWLYWGNGHWFSLAAIAAALLWIKLSKRKQTKQDDKERVIP